MSVKLLGRGFVWLDTGTMDSLFEDSDFVQMIQKYPGYRIICLDKMTHVGGICFSPGDG